MRKVAVLDIGKTNVKVALVDLPGRAEVAVRTMPNRVVASGPWPHFDVEGIWEFVLAALADLQAAHGIDGIAVTTHGACAALLDASGALAAPVMDYEHPLDRREAYDALRPSFALTGSPALPLGLNLGAQLHWQMAEDPGLRGRIAQVVMWPQYWGFRLTGRAACDVCSLGCHTDLWNPFAGALSPLVAQLGLEGRIATPRRPSEVLGTVSPELARRIGLSPAVPVLVGIHDSNASLVPHLTDRTRPFAVVSTGTWVVAMAMGGRPVTLDPARDTLVNVNAAGEPVPSARFMGGREFEMLREGRAGEATPAGAARVLREGVMLLPAVRPDSGPFQGRAMRWTVEPAGDGVLEVAAGFYLALMTAECLSLIGAEGTTVVEGPFAANPWFCAMLGAATGRAVVPADGRTGTAIGAAMLFAPGRTPAKPTRIPASPDPQMVAHAERWRGLL
jgi:sugar (pentulose or hexulose) kinase